MADLVVPDCEPRAGRCSAERCPREHRRWRNGGAVGTSEADAQGQQQAEGLEQRKRPDDERRASGSGQRQGAPRGVADIGRGRILSEGARGCESGRVVAEGGHCLFLLCDNIPRLMNQANAYEVRQTGVSRSSCLSAGLDRAYSSSAFSSVCRFDMRWCFPSE